MNNKNPYTLEELKTAIRKALKQEDTLPESIRNLDKKYKSLRENDACMPSHPKEAYAKAGWKSMRDLFDLQEIVFYT
ncbi:hypothetical protein CGH51_23325, partial [Vibrio parahaemolyticus]